MSDLVAVAVVTGLFSFVVAVPAWASAVYGWIHAKQVETLRVEINGKLEAALAAREALGYARGRADEKSRITAK